MDILYILLLLIINGVVVRVSVRFEKDCIFR